VQVTINILRYKYSYVRVCVCVSIYIYIYMKGDSEIGCRICYVFFFFLICKKFQGTLNLIFAGGVAPVSFLGSATIIKFCFVLY
jgi:hypothetical protein